MVTDPSDAHRFAVSLLSDPVAMFALDRMQLYNLTAAAVDISGWGVKDNDNTCTFAFPAGTSIPAGAY